MAQSNNEVNSVPQPEVGIEASKWQGSLVLIQEDKASAWIMCPEEDTIEIES